MKKRSVGAVLVTLALVGCAASELDTPDHDPALRDPAVSTDMLTSAPGAR